MIGNLFSIPWILLYSALFGLTMKTADLFDEHEMRWFKGCVIAKGEIERFKRNF